MNRIAVSCAFFTALLAWSLSGEGAFSRHFIIVGLKLSEKLAAFGLDGGREI